MERARRNAWCQEMRAEGEAGGHVTSAPAAVGEEKNVGVVSETQELAVSTAPAPPAPPAPTGEEKRGERGKRGSRVKLSEARTTYAA